MSKEIEADLIKRGKELVEKTQTLEKEIQILTESKRILDKDGVKRYFFSRLIPRLNLMINDYLNKFGMPIIFSFDETFEETIKDQYGNETPYGAYSGGETIKINNAIIFSFQKINKIINDFNMNVLLLDEYFDAAIDAETLEELLGNLKDVVIEENLCAYLISHREIDDSMYIDSVIEVTKTNGFSSLKIGKN